MPQMQEEVDEWQLLGQHGTRMYQVPHQRLPSQTGMVYCVPSHTVQAEPLAIELEKKIMEKSHLAFTTFLLKPF